MRLMHFRLFPQWIYNGQRWFESVSYGFISFKWSLHQKFVNVWNLALKNEKGQTFLVYCEFWSEKTTNRAYSVFFQIEIFWKTKIMKKKKTITWASI